MKPLLLSIILLTVPFTMAHGVTYHCYELSNPTPTNKLKTFEAFSHNTLSKKQLSEECAKANPIECMEHSCDACVGENCIEKRLEQGR